MRLKEKLEKKFKNIEKGIIDKDVYSYEDYDSKYTFLKPRVYVCVEFTDGKTAKIDVTEDFKEVVK